MGCTQNQFFDREQLSESRCSSTPIFHIEPFGLWRIRRPLDGWLAHPIPANWLMIIFVVLNYYSSQHKCVLVLEYICVSKNKSVCCTNSSNAHHAHIQYMLQYASKFLPRDGTWLMINAPKLVLES